jgi:Arc/MetJ-type ribon-helix-helix transcriptional regulator
MKIILNPEQEQIIRDLVSAGRYDSPDAVVAAALEELRQFMSGLPTPAEERKLLECALQSADRGDYRTLRTEKDVNALVEEIRGKTAARRNREGSLVK